MVALTCSSIVVPASGAAAPAPAADAVAELEAVIDGLATLAVDRDQVANVASLMLERDAGILVLEEGVLALCKPVNGRVCAALFVGRGAFSFTPPDEVERGQLQRFYGVRALRETFTSLVLVFADSTLDELRAVARFAAGAEPADASRLLSHAGGYLVDRPEKRFRNSSVGRAMLRGGRTGLFYSQVNRETREPLFLVVDPFERESIQLLRETDQPALGQKRRGQDVVSQFAPAGAAAGQAGGDERADVETSDYRIVSTVSQGLDYRQSTEVTVRSRVDSLRWVHFWIYSDLRADSAAWNGVPTGFQQGKDSWLVWVRCEPPLARNETRRLALAFAGKLIRRDGDLVTMKSSILWYPRHDFEGRARFELVYRVPESLQLASVGQRVDVSTARGVTTSRWVSEDPIWNATFNLGLFKTYEVVDERVAPIRVMIASAKDAGKSETVRVEHGRSLGGNIDRLAAAEFANAVAFFQHVYGPPILPLVTSEVVEFHGEAFPGLIETTLMDMQLLINMGNPLAGDRQWHRMMRAHEVAHQWWGYGVDPATYHDRWLSEGFAEWSSLWYLQAAAQDAPLYLRILKEWREAILTNRRGAFGLGRGLEAGPIWLGGRTASSRTEGDYSLIVYKKSAWVLHMLRNLMLDIDTLDDARFMAMMRDFYMTHRGRRASTEDFQRVVSEHVGEDMGWFFRQWVYGTAVPKVRFSHRTSAAGSGRRVTCRIELANVPDGFRIDTPVLLRFKDNRYARVRVRAIAPVTEIDLPPVPEEPLKVTFNDLESVLGEIVGP